MEFDAADRDQLSPQEKVFGVVELLSLILEYATPKREKQDLLRYRAVGRLWANCADRLFKEPPFKITLELEEMLAHKKIYHVKTFIPMEVTVKGWLSIRKLLFLDDFSENIQILHLVGVEGVDPKADYPPDMPKLRKLIVNNQFEVYYKPGTTFNFIDNLAKVSPLLESFKVIYDEDVTQHFQGIRSNYTLPRLMTELKAVNADASSLGKILQQNNLQNLSDAEFHLKHTSSRYLDISRILNNQFGFINLKKLKLHFEPPQDAYIWMYPLSTLEEFETNVSIVTFDLITPLSGCLPKLKSLTCKGGLRTTFCTILMEGSNFENLQSLTLHGSIFARYDYRNLDELDWQFNEGKILEKITRPGFPRFPNLVSLTWKGFSRVVTERTIPRIFASANKLADLNISLHNIFVLCSRYFSDEFNSLGGTNFNRLTTLSVRNDDKEFLDGSMDELLYQYISISLPDLQTITLGENVLIYDYTKHLWEVSGRKMIVDPANIKEFDGLGVEKFRVFDRYKLYFGLGDLKFFELP